MEDHNAYRIRKSSEGKSSYYVERHRKTILNKSGYVLKNGPGNYQKLLNNGFCDHECSLLNSSRHWVYFYKFDSGRRFDDLGVFENGCNFHLDNEKSHLKNHLVCRAFSASKIVEIRDHTMHLKICKDSLTEIIEDVKLDSENDILFFLKHFFSIEIDYEIRGVRKS